MAQATRDVIREQVAAEVVFAIGFFPTDDYVRAQHTQRVAVGGREIEVDCLLSLDDIDLDEVLEGHQSAEIGVALLQWQLTHGIEVVVDRALYQIKAAEASLRG